MAEREDRMNAERFARILEAYGADPRRWPAAERAACEAFAAADPQAGAALGAERALDELLDALPPVAPSLALRTRILSATPRATPPLARPAKPERARGSLQGLLGGFGLGGGLGETLALPRLPASALSLFAASAAFGLYLGMAGPAWVTGVSESAAYETAKVDAVVLAFGARGFEDGGDFGEGSVQ
ncbi:MAG: hypothetical protein H6923_10350 [Alphaproteobacteria bacterium]|nr:hypothetical protein [Alphaproteobacteria bacterium]